MKCHEAMRHLDPFMDGELSVPENLSVLAHLNLCVSCSQGYEGEKSLRETLRQTWTYPTPPTLGQKVHVALVRSRRRWWGWLGFAAVALVATSVTLVLLLQPSKVDANGIVAKAVETHESLKSEGGEICLRACCAPDAAKTLHERGYDPCLHEMAGYEYRAASVREINGKAICWTVQRDGSGQLVTHTAVQMQLTPERWALIEKDGRVVVLVSRPDGFT